MTSISPASAPVAAPVTPAAPVSRRSPLLEWYSLLPWWGRIIVIFLASRVVTTAILLVFAWIQPANYWTGAHPDYFSFAAIWDGDWYHSVSQYGYPSRLPRTSDGHIDQNAWAFLPAYPILVAILSGHISAAFNVVAVLVSTGFALGSALVFYRLMEPRLGASTAMFSVVLFCFAPLSPIYQVAYAESMLVFFLACSLYYLERRRYGTMMAFVTVMAFTRPSALPFALALAAHVVYRWVVRARDPFPVRERIAATLSVVATVLLGLAWPAIATLVTHVPNAYVDTELSWRQPYVGWAGLVPFAGWIQGANWWIPQKPFGVIELVVVVALFAAFMFSRWSKPLGENLRLWVGSWVLYLLAVVFPMSSIFRLLIPVFPLLGIVAMPRSRAYRVGIVVAFIAAQVGWVYIAYWFDGYDWTPP